MMKFQCPGFKTIFFLTFLAIISLSFVLVAPSEPAQTTTTTTTISANAPKKDHSKQYLYDSLKLDSLSLSREAFDYAVKGLDKLEDQGVLHNDSILSIVDFGLPSSQKRLFIINLNSGELLFNTFVSHGRNSGKERATSFSNRINSFESSLGFYVTGATYKGEHGYSLRLQGMERGINDNALARGIVMHSADYVNEQLIKKQGYLGRSLGCPAVPVKLHKAIISTIKEGSCLFLYSPDKKYLASSNILKSYLLS